MRELNTSSLEMVKQELTEQCRTLANSCDAYRKDPGRDALQLLVEQTAAMRGACEIVEIGGAVALFTELEELLKEHGDRLIDNQAFPDDLANVLQIAEGYLGYVHKREVDHPLLLLLEINLIRGYANKQPLGEFHFLADSLPADNVIDFVNEKSADIRLVLRRARHMFQQGLIHAIRGTGQSGSFRIMSHAVRRVHQTLGDEREKLYWLLVFQVIEGFAKRALTADKTKLRTLMAVERQLRQLVQGNCNLDQCYPVDLQRNMMAYLLLADLQSDTATKVMRQLGLETCEVSDRQIAADRALLGSEGEQSFSDTMSLLKDKIDMLASLIELIEDDELDQQSREEILPAVLGVAEICGISGLATGAKLFGDYAQQIQAAAGGKLDHKLIESIIDSILYLECLLLELEGRVPNIQQLNEINKKPCQEVIESNITKHAEVQVIDQSRAKLREVMSRLTDMQEGVGGFSLDDDFHEVFDTVSGATRMLNLDKASNIAKQCSQYARSGKLLTDLPDEESMASFADVLVSLEYYLDNCRWDRNFDDAVLDIAEECLEQLK